MTQAFSKASELPTLAPHPHYLRTLRLHEVPGYLPGWKQPAVLAEFQLLAPVPELVLRHFMSVVERTFGSVPAAASFPEFTRWPVLPCVASATLAALQGAGWPLLGNIAIVKNSANVDDRITLAFPSMHASAQGVVLALQEVLALLYLLASGKDLSTEYEKILRERLQPLKALAPTGMNTLRFIEAAHAQGVPWKRLTGNVYQFGWGARARWLDSSFTDTTPGISTKLSRDKRATASILRRAGVPVPAHRAVASEAEALQVAERLGYPVVVKPANLDRGAGVFAYLESSGEVARAFATARSLSPQVLVEKHVFGNDYRLQVFEGEVFWVTQRIPAGVTGDGLHSVRALVDATNADPRRGGPESAGLKRIVLDAETETWLKRQALTLDTVPAAGRVVRLRGAANVASGGTIAPVPVTTAHPDNLALAARAASILRLDIAGIDLLIPDIAHSWLETGAAICEVNAQPQMSAHLPAELLPRLVKRQGRIPVVVVLGGTRTEPNCADLITGLCTARTGVGLASRDGAWIDGSQVARGPLQGIQAGICLLDDPSVQVAILHVEDADMLQSGCPVDSIDHLVLAGPLTQKDSHGADWHATLMLATWLTAMSRKAWLFDTAPEWQRLVSVPRATSDLNMLLNNIAGAFATGNTP